MQLAHGLDREHYETMPKRVIDGILIAVLVTIVALAIFSPRFQWIIAYRGPVTEQMRKGVH